jgi:hypothetical protein
MKLFANGCSFTFGGGLNMYNNTWADDNGITHWFSSTSTLPKNLERLSVTWPARLAEMLDAEKYINMSRGGGSNSRIVRTTLDYFLDLLDRGEDISDYVAVIQWSDVTRKEYYIDKYWSVTGVNFAYHEFRNGEQLLDLDERKEYYYKKLHSDRQDVTDFISHVSALGGFFEKFNIPYVFCTHINSIGWSLADYTDSGEVDDLKARLAQVDQLYPWLENSYLGSEMLRFNLDPCSIDPYDGHPSVLGNQQFAEIMHNWIVKNEIVC